MADSSSKNTAIVAYGMAVITIAVLSLALYSLFTISDPAIGVTSMILILLAILALARGVHPMLKRLYSWQLFRARTEDALHSAKKSAIRIFNRVTGR